MAEESFIQSSTGIEHLPIPVLGQENGEQPDLKPSIPGNSQICVVLEFPTGNSQSHAGLEPFTPGNSKIWAALKFLPGTARSLLYWHFHTWEQADLCFTENFYLGIARSALYWKFLPGKSQICIALNLPHPRTTRSVLHWNFCLGAMGLPFHSKKSLIEKAPGRQKDWWKMLNPHCLVWRSTITMWAAKFKFTFKEYMQVDLIFPYK